MEDRSRPKTMWIMVAITVIVTAVVAVGVVTTSRERREQRQIQAEEEQLKTLDLLDRMDKGLGKPSSLTSAQQEELRQLRERAAKRKIEQGLTK